MPVARKNHRRALLKGLRVVVTRELGDRELSPLLAAAGARVIPIPAIELKTLQGTGWRFFGDSHGYDWIVLSSKIGARLFFEKLRGARVGARRLGGARFACVGRPTAEALERHGFRSALTPRVYTQEGLAGSFRRIPLRGKRVLLARAWEARDCLAKALKTRGAEVRIWNLYRTRCPRGSRRLARQTFGNDAKVDLLTFTSSLAVRHFMRFFTREQRRKWLRGIPIASIGPVTTRTLETFGFRATVQPGKCTMRALATAIMRWAGAKARAAHQNH